MGLKRARPRPWLARCMGQPSETLITGGAGDLRHAARMRSAIGQSASPLGKASSIVAAKQILQVRSGGREELRAESFLTVVLGHCGFFSREEVTSLFSAGV